MPRLKKVEKVEVVAGARGPEHAAKPASISKKEEEEAVEEMPRILGALPADTVEFHSIYAIHPKGCHVVVLTSPRAWTDSSGVQHNERGMSLKFHNGRALVSDPEIIKRAKAHPNFNRDFWDAREALEKALQKRAVQAEENIAASADRIKDNPEQVKRLLEHLGITDYKLPDRKPKANPAPEPETEPESDTNE